jgi:hypothetical protein
MFSGCDQPVPDGPQAAVLFHLNQLFRVQWNEESIQFEYENAHHIKRISANGLLNDYMNPSSSKDQTILIRIEFFNVIPLFVASYSNQWGIAIGSICDHPFIYCNEIVYDNSDGSSEQIEFIGLPTTTTTIQSMDKLNALFAYVIRWFLEHASDRQH